MAVGTLLNVSVAGICCTVPDNPIQTEAYIDNFGADAVNKFVKMTGVKQRYISKGKQTASDLCFSAAEALVSNIKWDKSSIDVLIFISQTPDYRLPATACVLHKRLGLSQECIAFDVNLGCSGYVYGLQIIGSLFQNSNVNRALLLCGDTPSFYVSPNDKSATMLFGDAGSATALERDTSHRIVFSLKTNGNGYQNIIIPSGCCRNLDGNHERIERAEGIFRNDFELAMDGTEVFNFTISDVPKTITEFLQYNDESPDSYEAFVLHQANLFMLNHIAKKVKIPPAKLPISIDRFGNTSSASIPLSIVDMYSKRGGTPLSYDNCKDHLLLAGFGVGLSWGVLSLDIYAKTCLPIIYTNEYFSEE